jgi:hypothetical protein
MGDVGKEQIKVLSKSQKPVVNDHTHLENKASFNKKLTVSLGRPELRCLLKVACLLKIHSLKQLFFVCNIFILHKKRKI